MKALEIAAKCRIFFEGADAETTAKNFTVKAVSADKAYLSHDNLGLVAALGGAAYVPFKSNSSAGEEGSLWERLYHYYQFRREEFPKHYHQRSNVESTFSAVKRKFGEAVRAKTEVAMKNEALAKLVCHNITTVIGAMLRHSPYRWRTPVVSDPDRLFCSKVIDQLDQIAEDFFLRVIRMVGVDA